MNIVKENLYPMPARRIEVCGHCYETSAWRIDSTMTNGGLWTDYECDKHARKWWPNLFPAS